MTTGLYIANHSNNDDAAALRLGDLIESSEAGRCCRGDHVKMFGASLSSLDASSTRPVRQHSALRSDVSSHVAVRHQQTCLAIRRIFMRRSKSQAKARPVYQQRPTEFSSDLRSAAFQRRSKSPQIMARRSTREARSRSVSLYFELFSFEFGLWLR